MPPLLNRPIVASALLLIWARSAGASDVSIQQVLRSGASRLSFQARPIATPDKYDAWRVYDSSGLEDFVRFTAPPPDEQLLYKITTNTLPVVQVRENQIECYDGDGQLRFLVESPWLLDAT